MKSIFKIVSVAVAASFLAACGGSSSSQNQVVDYEMNYSLDGASFDMVKVPAGYFSMGISSDNRRKVTNGVPHEVALDGFVISAKPVSQALWESLMGGNPSSVKNPDAPVDMVSWKDVQKFIGKLNKKTGKTFSLPTEAQWEYTQKLGAGDGLLSIAEWCDDSYYAFSDGDDLFNPMLLAVNPGSIKDGDRKVVRTSLERLEVDCHTSRAGVGFRLAQPTEEALSEDLMTVLEGNTFSRETVNAAEGGFEDFNVGGVTFRMMKVKGGEFTMGCSAKDTPYGNFKIPDNEAKTHPVTVSDYMMGETEVTVGLWNAVMGSVPYLNDVAEPEKPVGNVSWYDSQLFIQKLNALTGRTFRLPTEAEWEYAARGGSKTHFYGFSGTNDMNKAMWFLDNADMKCKAVKGKKANELGLYDMSGNVWEWCYDRAADYTSDPAVDPAGPSEGTTRILRGGSCASRWDACRITNRSFMPAKNIKGTFGLRLAI